MIIEKQLFLEIIKNIQEQKAIDEEIDKSLQKICGSWVCFQTENKIYKVLEQLLKTVLGKEKYQDLEWWLYEKPNNCNSFEFNKKEIDVSTIDKLYDFWTENYDNSNINNSGNRNDNK